MEPTETIIKVGKYKFKITDNTLSARGQIYSRNFKIGGNNLDCMHISISYKENIPVSASIPHIMYDPECSLNIHLDRGQGSIIMIKTLLKHVHEKMPTITEVHFEDKSHIECASEYEIQKKDSKFRKKGTHIYPIPLYYFSISFNGKTWYEKHFKAKQQNISKHAAYREKINELLHSEHVKMATSYLQFLETAQPPMEIVDELEHYFNSSKTFETFFQSIPKKDRCRLVRDWISVFMSFHLKDVFDNNDWIMDLPLVNGLSGGLRGNKSGNINGENRTTRKYYCPRGRIMHKKTYRDFGVDMNYV